MFSQIPEDDHPQNNKIPSKKRNKRKKKNNLNKNNFKRDKRKQTKTVCPMSSMAENLDKIGSWQLKHQVAYWKARAKSLEYENKVLHDIIRRRQLQGSNVSQSESDDDTEEPERKEEPEDVEDHEMTDGGDENLEVSEEYIQFLITNAKYKEEARKERERLKALKEAKELEKREQEEKELAAVAFEEMEPETPEERQGLWEELYGEGWQRISALEMSLHAQYINESDKSKPAYWPNVPFNPFDTPYVYIP